MKIEESAETFSQYWSRTREQIDAALEQRIADLFATAPGFGLEAVIRAVDGGKRIRGCLVCLICNVLGGSTDAALARAAAVECVQAASLIHDDYIDRDASRRGRPAGWIVDGSRRAVLVGDVMFATIIEQMAENCAEEGALIARTIAAMARGAYLEQSNGNFLDGVELGRRIEKLERDYDDIIRLKTAELFATAAKLGAFAAGTPENIRQTCFDFGMCLGEAYQLADDLADITQFQNSTGDDVARLVAIAPMMTRFSDSRPNGLERLELENTSVFRDWVSTEIPAVRNRVSRTISGLQRKSVSILASLPENRFRSMLCEMPEEVTKAAR